MTLREFVTTTRRYEIHGLYTTPTRDYLFDNFKNNLEEWINKYGDCRVVDTQEEEDVYGGKFTWVYIDNRDMNISGRI